eukprot:TRINITY_DN1548_c0_g1_i5.p1 TRINITY_DN1548_c0_g1~~TRINITY_DN1548_c0_g1_i5.p1  ORF type:complete len:355 (-),score=83.28 TRINITY_DN1548_c0_g1_i5:791-1720(-)
MYLLLQPAFVSPESDNFNPDDEDLIAELLEDTKVRIMEVLYLEEAARVRALLHEPRFVSPESDNFSPDDEDLIAELPEDTEVRVIEVLYFEEAARVRALLHEPRGWITLENLSTGRRFAEPVDSTDADPVQNADMGEPQARIHAFDEPLARPDYRTGMYLLLQPVFVSPESDNFNPDDEDLIAELPEDTEVCVMEVLHFEEAGRVRALLHEPRGWITLENLTTGRRFAEPVDSADAENLLLDPVQNADMGEPQARIHAFDEPLARPDYRTGMYLLLQPVTICRASRHSWNLLAVEDSGCLTIYQSLGSE